MKKCEMCLKKKEDTEAVEIYNPEDFVTFDTCFICQDCQDNYLAYCHRVGCGKHIYDTDRPATDWDSMIPYGKDFESEDERRKAISEMELVFYCDHCLPAPNPTPAPPPDAP